LGEQVLTSKSARLDGAVESFASGLELLDVDGSSLVRVDKTLDLQLEFSLHDFDTRQLFGRARDSLTTGLPCGELLLKH
jgi:hypothetical protein